MVARTPETAVSTVEHGGVGYQIVTAGMGKFGKTCHIRFRDDLGSRVVVHDRSVP